MHRFCVFVVLLCVVSSANATSKDFDQQLYSFDQHVRSEFSNICDDVRSIQAQLAKDAGYNPRPVEHSYLSKALEDSRRQADELRASLDSATKDVVAALNATNRQFEADIALMRASMCLDCEGISWVGCVAYQFVVTYLGFFRRYWLPIVLLLLVGHCMDVYQRMHHLA